MKAMLDPRMVAASIHVFASAAAGTPAAVDRITTSSQGVLMEAMDAIQGALGSAARTGRLAKGTLIMANT